MRRAQLLAIVSAIPVLMGVVAPHPVWADELADLKAQMQRMEEQHQKELAALRARLEVLEAQEQTRLAAKAPLTSPKDLAEQVAGLADETAYLKDRQESLATNLKQQLEWHLYATLAFEKFQKRHSAFDAQKVELLASGYLTDRLKAFTEIEFENVATIEAGSRAGDISLEQGYLEYTLNDYLKPRAGVILVPFGRFNLEHFATVMELTEKPLMARRILSAEWADVGAGLTGTAPLGEVLPTEWLKGLSVNYQGFFVNGLTNALTDTGFRDARSSFASDNNNNKALVGRVGISPVAGQELGLSGYFGNYDNAGHSINGVDLDWKLAYGPVDLLGEYALVDLQRGFEADGTTLVPKTLSGLYLQAAYHFWLPVLDQTFLKGDFKHPKLTLVGRYDRASILAPSAPNVEERWTLGFNYRPVPTWVYKIEYAWNHTKRQPLERGDLDGVVASVSAAF